MAAVRQDKCIVHVFVDGPWCSQESRWDDNDGSRCAESVFLVVEGVSTYKETVCVCGVRMSDERM